MTLRTQDDTLRRHSHARRFFKERSFVNIVADEDDFAQEDERCIDRQMRAEEEDEEEGKRRLFCGRKCFMDVHVGREPSQVSRVRPPEEDVA